MKVPKAARPKEIENPNRAPILKYMIPLTMLPVSSAV